MTSLGETVRGPAVPPLSVEEEQRLTRAWRDHGDRKAAQRLVEAHQRLVSRVAHGLRGYGVPMAELISEGNVGLVQALKGFDPERNLRFATYAVWWIRAAMLELVMQQATPVKVAMTAERKKIFFKLRSLAARLKPGGGWLSQDEAREIARQLSVREEQVLEMERLLSAAEMSLDAPRGDEDGEMTWGQMLADDSPDPETLAADRQEREIQRRMLAEAWRSLSEREQHIISERCLREQPSRLEDLAKRYGISRERVRQIEMAAMKKLKKLIGGAGLMPQSA